MPWALPLNEHVCILELYHTKLCLQCSVTQTYRDLGGLWEISIMPIPYLWHLWTGYPWETGILFEQEITAIGFLLIGQVETKVTEWNNKRLIYTLLYINVYNRPQVYRISLTHNSWLGNTLHHGFLSMWQWVCLIIWRHKCNHNSRMHWGILRSKRRGDGVSDVNSCIFPGAVLYCSQTFCVQLFQSCPRVACLHFTPLPLIPSTANCMVQNRIAVTDKNILE